MRAALRNAAAVIVLFLALVFPIGYLAFTAPIAVRVSQAASWLGLDRHAEPGDAIVDCVLLFSFLLAIASVCFVNAVALRRKRRFANVE